MRPQCPVADTSPLRLATVSETATVSAVAPNTRGTSSATVSAPTPSQGRALPQTPGVSAWRGAREYERLRARPALLEAKPGDQQVVELIEFLKMPYGGWEGISLIQYNSLKNEVLDQLVRQRPMKSGLGSLIVRMYRDHQFDSMWRDYCVQHFAVYYEARWPGGSPPAGDGEARMIRDALGEAVRETDSTIAGSALIGMERLSRRYPEMDRAVVANLALSLALSDASPAATRTTALQLCGVMQQREALPVARRMALGATPLTLQLAAVSALGELGDATDAVLLRQLASSNSYVYIRTAASSALQRLSSRHD